MYNLNRDMICDTIKKFYHFKECSCEVSHLEDKGNTRRRVHVRVKDGETFFLDFHFKKDGSTSFDLNSGGKMEIKEQIADFIIADPECALVDVTSSSKWYVAKGIEHSDFLALIDLLSESEFSKDLNTKVNDVFEQYKFTGNYGETLTIHYYLTKNKVMLQGRPLLLFIEAMSLIAESIELDELPHFFNENYELSIAKSDIEQQFDYFFPYSSDKHPTKIKRVLHQAVYNLQVDGDMFEYTYLVFPALRAMEGHLKYTLYNHKINLEKNNFVMFKFDEKSQKYKLKEKYHDKIGSVSKVNYFEKAYNHYNKHRHSLFHWADPSSPLDDTRFIESLGDVKALIRDTFTLIDEYYKS